MDDNRRRFLKISTLVAAGVLASPSLVLGSNQNSTRRTGSSRSTDYDVIIIGGGLAGLTTAYRLEQAGYDNILTLEAKSNVGGRTLNIPVSGGYVAEGGGQWIGPGQTAIANLMTELGISSFPSYTTGTDINASNLTAAAQADYDNAVSMLNSMALTVPLTDPWNAASASTWDNMTLDDWMSANMTTFGGYLELYTAVATFLSAEPPNISLLYFLFYVHSAGTVEALTDDAQQDRIDGGAQAISLALLGALSSTVNVGAAVSEINDLGTEVKVTYGVTAVTAKKVVVAMMPKDADGITFTSGLSATRQGLQSNWGTASGTKISVVYSTPFWRGAGFSGTAFGTDLSFVTDNSPDDASSGILVGFPSAGFMALPAGNREQAAKDELESFFGAAAQSNLDYTETNWDDETTISGCVSPLPMGFLTTYGTALRVPEGNIHWAGTETSEIWTGYMDGAIRSGERVASELTALLSVHERPQIEFDVFPNPCVDRIKINSASAIHGVQIYDLSGKLVKELEDAQQIDLSNIRSGSYSIKVSTDAGVGVQSLIKN